MYRDAVTHPISNHAQHRATTLIETNVLSLDHAATIAVIIMLLLCGPPRTKTAQRVTVTDVTGTRCFKFKLFVTELHANTEQTESNSGRATLQIMLELTVTDQLGTVTIAN